VEWLVTWQVIMAPWVPRRDAQLGIMKRSIKTTLESTDRGGRPACGKRGAETLWRSQFIFPVTTQVDEHGQAIPAS
jgi:hypothetical protein